MRVVIAEDELLLREGVARLLADAGIDVVATVETADALIDRVEPSVDTARFVKRLSADEFFLRDHKVAGMAVRGAAAVPAGG